MPTRAPNQDPQLLLRAARGEDFDELYAFLFLNPDPAIRRRTRSEVEAMIQRGLFFIARLRNTGRIIAASYLDDPKEEGEDSWELGGAYVQKAFRRTGIFRLLSLVAIANVFVLYAPQDDIIGHVLSTNPKPRTVLESLGFVKTREAVPYHIHQYPGLDHMTPDANGYVYADIYTLSPSKYCSLIRELLAFPGHLEAADGQRWTLSIEVPALAPDVLREVLADCE